MRMPGGGESETCCICGRPLPNRFAVAGRCEAAGCAAPFCAMHWHRGNRRCPAHGGGAESVPAREPDREGKEKGSKMGDKDDKELCARADAKLPAARKASILKQIGEFAVALGKGAGALARRMAGMKSTDEALSEIDARIAASRAAREPASRRYEELYKAISAKKKLYQAAPPARKKILEMELKSAIAEYQSLERQISAYLKNETILAKVKGRMCELVAMNLKGVTEDDIDKLADSIEDAATAAEDIDGAVADMDKAGFRREREDSSFEDALAAFGGDFDEPAHETTGAEPGVEPGAAESPAPDAPLADL